MTNRLSQKEIRSIGVYLIVILALIRFLVYPLYASVDGGKKMLAEQYESYQVKTSLLERQILDKKKQERGSKTPAIDQHTVLSKFYDKGIRYSSIQADIIESLVKLVENKGMMVLDFELLEPVAGQNISEVPVLIRISGRPGPFIDVLGETELSDKALIIKSMEINKVGSDFRFFVTLSAFRKER